MEKTWIAKFGTSWRILRAKDGSQGVWAGDYKTADEAFGAAEREYRE
jgi:hypothetical protein